MVAVQVDMVGMERARNRAVPASVAVVRIVLLVEFGEDGGEEHKLAKMPVLPLLYIKIGGAATK